jgi:myo-inositol-1(or 4)-monophosphatase
MDLDHAARVTEQSAETGAAVADDLFRTHLDIEQKDGKTDLVSRADHETQAAVVDHITDHYPDATICGEEGSDDTAIPDTGLAWVIDPIDGTNNYVRGNRQWATSVACLLDGETVAAANVLPALEDRYVATPEGVRRNGTEVSVSDRTDPERFEVAPTVWWDFDRRDEYTVAAEEVIRRFGDLRRLGSAQAELSLLAAGALDGVFTNIETNPWDTVAGAAMVEWAGGRVTDIEGRPWRHDRRGLVASNGQAHDELLAAAQATDSA